MKSGLVLFSVIAFTLVSCAGSPPSEKASASAPPEAAPQKPRDGPGPERPSPTGLESDVFDDLPDGTRDYLVRLAEAVARRDAAFLLTQGERDYEARVRPAVDEEAYLALLYRVGPYASESPLDLDRPPRLVPSRLRSIRYTGWEERGSVVEIRGLISLSGGPPLPCRISVLWKLREPRVIGREL